MKQAEKIPDISVLVSAFNEEQHIHIAIDSILLEKTLDIELILVDDCSTDRTLEIMKAYAEQDFRVRVIQVVNNKLNEDVKNDIIFRSTKFETPSYSIASSQNIGLNFCTGKYIARLDADDLMINGRLTKQFTYMEENTQIDLVACGGERINENGDVFGEYLINSTEHNDICEDLVLMRSRMPHPGWLVKNDVYIAMQGYSLSYANFRLDLDFMLRMIEQGYKMACLKAPLIQYRQWPGNISKLNKMELATIYTLCRHHLRLHGLEINSKVNQSMEEMVTSQAQEIKLFESLNAYQMLKSSFISFREHLFLQAISFLIKAIKFDYTLIFNKNNAKRKQLKIIDTVVNKILSDENIFYEKNR